VKYTLYDGPDALIANKLLELGVTINPNNVDWYKRTLIEQQQRSRVAAVATNGGSA
jgi:spermidine/putrescine-binding protein